jgi:hypothetical protein
VLPSHSPITFTSPSHSLNTFTYPLYSPIIFANMMFSTILFTLASAACALAASREPPPTTYLWSANVTSGNISVIGSTPLGNRVVIPIASGEFAGPNLSGKAEQTLPRLRARTVAY